MKDKIKRYFNITDTSKDAIIQDIIDHAEALKVALGFDSALVYPIVIEDFSEYLKSGNTAFQTASTTEGLNRFSPDLIQLIRMTMKGVSF